MKTSLEATISLTLLRDHTFAWNGFAGFHSAFIDDFDLYPA
jgi:hypothetical protein